MLLLPASTGPLDPLIAFRLMIANLCLHVQTHLRTRVPAPLAEPLQSLILWRLKRIGFLVERLVGRLRAGRVRGRRVTVRVAAAERAAVERRPRERASPLLGLPRRFGWLIPLVPMVKLYSGGLAHWMAQPEVAPWMDVPGMDRVLRPLCRMLGVAEPAAFRRAALVPSAEPRAAATNDATAPTTVAEPPPPTACGAGCAEVSPAAFGARSPPSAGSGAGGQNSA